MRKLCKFFLFIIIVISLSPAALALEPQDALSARSDKSFYVTARIGDLNGLLQNIFSMENIEAVASLAGPEDAQMVRLMGSLISQIPAKTVAFAGGFAEDKSPFVQIAASMPASARSKLDRVADGSASGIDLITLIGGDGGMMFAAGMEPVLQKGPKGPYYALGPIAFAAREDVLIAALSPAGLDEALDALENPAGRLAFKRRFDTPSYYAFNMDMPTLAALAQEDHRERGGKADFDVESVRSVFKAPIKMEMGFDAKPETFLMSVGVNVMEAMADKYVSFFKDIEPAGANLFLAGGGKVFLALASPLYMQADTFRLDPVMAGLWDKVVKNLEKRGITEKDVEDLLTGSFSLVLGSEATILGGRLPGGYLALSGHEGAAAKILGKILADEQFSQAVPMEPLKIEGWDSLFRVDPALFPASLLMGVSEDKNTLFLGVVDPGSVGAKPEFPAQGVKLFEEKLIGGGFIDTAAIWQYIRNEAANPDSPMAALLEDDPAGEAVKYLLDAELSIPFIKIWSADMETVFTEFTRADVPADKGLFNRLMKAGEALRMSEDDGEDGEYADEYEDESTEDIEEEQE